MASRKTDMYMIGGLMFELITGKRPYYWMAEELVFRYRLDQQAAGSTASTYEEALALPPAMRYALLLQRCWEVRLCERV